MKFHFPELKIMQFDGVGVRVEEINNTILLTFSSLVPLVVSGLLDTYHYYFFEGVVLGAFPCCNLLAV